MVGMMEDGGGAHASCARGLVASFVLAFERYVSFARTYRACVRANCLDYSLLSGRFLGSYIVHRANQSLTELHYEKCIL